VTPAVRDWLPADAFTGTAVEAALAAVIAQWSERWFKRADIGVRIASTNRAAAQDDVAAVEFPESGKRVLLEAALGMPVAGQSVTDGDRRVLDVFAIQIAEDLATALTKAFGTATSANAGRSITAMFSLSEGDLLSVSFPEHVVVPMLKARLIKSKLATGAMRKRIEALSQTKLSVEGVLGRAELAMSDLDELAVGDVVILDRALHEAIELRLSGSDRVIGRGKLGRSDGQISIQF
jgi:flagellar motor switch/type III secretory pathway protein FliN